jgi:hypothetical protein
VTDATEPSILEFIRGCLADGTDLEDVSLPDEQDEPGQLKFASGAWDGVITHQLAAGSDDPAEALAAAIREACETGAHTQVDDRASDTGLVGYIDAVLTDLRANMPDPASLYRLAGKLASQARLRGPVKLGIALLGLFPTQGHRDILLTLGQHEEFTLFAAVALDNGQDDADDDLWALAGSVHGWGRIHLVERLARTSRPEILDWLVREGFRNSILDEYLAYLAATRGALHDRLRSGNVDDDLLHAAGDLLQALINDCPAQDIYDYVEGADATCAFIDLLKTRATDLRHLIAAGAIREFASQPAPDLGWPPGWTNEMRRRLNDDCTEIVNRPLWSDLASTDLQSNDPETFWRAERAYRILDLPTLPALVGRLRQDPLDSGPWFHAISQADATTIDDVLALAEELLPLTAIATGPADEMGLGQPYAAHQCLDFVVQDLGKWPGRGWTLIAAALSSPVTRNRNMAINALTNWPRDTWPDTAMPALRTALLAEPTDSVRQRLTDLLA